jgi:hypothetical protein
MTNWYKVVQTLHHFVIRWNQSSDRQNVDSILPRKHCTVWTHEGCFKWLVTAEVTRSQTGASHNSTDGQAVGPSGESQLECWPVLEPISAVECRRNSFSFSAVEEERNKCMLDRQSSSVCPSRLSDYELNNSRPNLQLISIQVRRYTTR